jgi:hypothetical protein
MDASLPTSYKIRGTCTFFHIQQENTNCSHNIELPAKLGPITNFVSSLATAWSWLTHVCHPCIQSTPKMLDARCQATAFTTTNATKMWGILLNQACPSVRLHTTLLGCIFLHYGAPCLLYTLAQQPCAVCCLPLCYSILQCASFPSFRHGTYVLYSSSKHTALHGTASLTT